MNYSQFYNKYLALLTIVISILLIFLKCKKYLQKEFVAQITNNPNLLHQLAKHKNIYVRCNVAKNTNTTQNTLLLLANDINPFVRANVAKNINSNKNILDLLANDQFLFVKEDALNNPNYSLLPPQ
jgi:hypothetical protein